ncbi:MAG: hypothetical protein WCK27_17620 [Verrucomicrobiota bacterium]
MAVIGQHHLTQALGCSDSAAKPTPANSSSSGHGGSKRGTERSYQESAMRKHIPQLGPGSNLGRDEAIQLAVVVLVLGNRKPQGHQATSGMAASPCSTFANQHHPTDAWTRVFKPTHEILAQGLPAPDV